MMHQIQLNGKFWRSWAGACPGVEKELKKALKGEEGYTYHQVAFGDYPEGEDASHFNLGTGERVVPLPPKVVPQEDLWKQELEELLSKCVELDKASSRSLRAILCKTDTDSDRAMLQGIETEIQTKRLRIRELNNLIAEGVQ